jgi:hypothetical protein
VSFDALAWAAKQSPGSSGAKLVLLGLAECASRGHGLAFPSIAELVEFSCLDRKSVIANLDKLETQGLITDTGKRVGRTGQIKVYQVNLGTVPNTEPSQIRNSSVISANSPKNGTRNKSEPVSEDKSSGASADPVKDLIDMGVGLLTSTGTPERQARSLIGKWRKGRDISEIALAFADCRTKAIANPVEWLERRFKGAQFVSASGYEYRGDPKAVMKEAERRADWATYWSAKTAYEDQGTSRQKPANSDTLPDNVVQLARQVGSRA